MINELWKSVKGYEGLYEVSDKGRVRRVDGKVLKQQTSQFGYKVIKLNKNGKSKGYFVHRLVAEAFISKPTKAQCVNHIDECKTNNNVDNLEWVTYHENNYHGTARKRISETLHKYYEENGHHCRKPVRCIETDRIYSGVRVAGRELGINRGSLSSCLNGNRRTAGGFHWEFVE